jgi:transposase
MRPKGMTKTDLEARRLAAVTMVEAGISRREVARRLGCAPSSVIRWTQQFDEGGRDAIRAIPEEGKQHASYLDDADREKLRALLIAGPRAAGFATDLWSLSRIRLVVEREFGVTYSIGHLHRIVVGLGFSSQKPERRAREQDPAAVRNFRNRTWKRLKKRPNAKAGRSSS